MSSTQIFSAIHEQRAGGLAWLRYRLDMAGFEGSNPFRPIRKYRFIPSVLLYEGRTILAKETDQLQLISSIF